MRLYALGPDYIVSRMAFPTPSRYLFVLNTSLANSCQMRHGFRSSYAVKPRDVTWALKGDGASKASQERVWVGANPFPPSLIEDA